MQDVCAHCDLPLLHRDAEHVHLLVSSSPSWPHPLGQQHRGRVLLQLLQEFPRPRGGTTGEDQAAVARILFAGSVAGLPARSALVHRPAGPFALPVHVRPKTDTLAVAQVAGTTVRSAQRSLTDAAGQSSPAISGSSRRSGCSRWTWPSRHLSLNKASSAPSWRRVSTSVARCPARIRAPSASVSLASA